MTIKDLAALSGYSLGTVSRVLNNQPHVSEKAREQIMAIVKEQGFELNTNARNLKQTHSNNILVIVRGTHNELFAALVERLQTVATGGEYQLVVDYIGELDDETLFYFESRGIDRAQAENIMARAAVERFARTAGDEEFEKLVMSRLSEVL